MSHLKYSSKISMYSGHFVNKLTIASQNGGWVPQTSRSFHYWQPTPRWNCSHGWQIVATQPWAPVQKGTHHTDNIVIRWKLGRGGLWTNAEWQYNKHKGSICMGTTEDHWMHRVSNTSSKHVLAQLHEQKKQNAREWDPWQMHWHKCLTKHFCTRRNVDLCECTGVCA